MLLTTQSPPTHPLTPSWSRFYRYSSSALLAGVLTMSAACSGSSPDDNTTDAAVTGPQPVAEQRPADSAAAPLTLVDEKPEPAASVTPADSADSAPDNAPSLNQGNETTAQTEPVSPSPNAEPMSDIEDDERLAALDALIDELDFTTARTRAAEWAAETEDPDLRHRLDERARLYSGYVQQEHQVRSNLALLTGNRLQRQAAMVDLLRGGPLIEMLMEAVVQPDIEVTDDDAAIVVTVVELAQAMNLDVYTAALERHQHSPAGELRDGISEYLIAIVNDAPERYATALWDMAMAAEPAAVSNLMPTLGELLAQPGLLPETAPGQFRALILRAAEALDGGQSDERGAIFATALEMEDDSFASEVMEALGPGDTDMVGLPPGWSASDIGDVKVSGSVEFTEGAFVVRGAGENFWGSEDGGHMAWRKVSGDVSFRAQLTNIEHAHKYTKAGISFRRSLDAGSPHASMLASPGDRDGYRFVLGTRREEGGSSSNDGSEYLPLPQWIQLRREGEDIIGEVSVDGENWEELARRSVDLGEEFYLGVVVSARRTGELAEAAIQVPLDDLF